MAIRKFLDISTAHVSPAARQWLEANAWASAAHSPGMVEPERVAAFVTGWIMFAPEIEHIAESGIDNDLIVPCMFARGLGCDYICFDADAETLAELPVYEEEEGTTEGLTDEEKVVLDMVAKDISEMPLTIYGSGTLTNEKGEALSLEEAKEALYRFISNPTDASGLADELAEPNELEWPLDATSDTDKVYIVDGRPYLSTRGIAEMLMREGVDQGLINTIITRIASAAKKRLTMRFALYAAEKAIVSAYGEPDGTSLENKNAMMALQLVRDAKRT